MITIIIGLIPIPPKILHVANQEAIARGDLTFGHGIVFGFYIIAAFLICCAAIWFKRWMAHGMDRETHLKG